jgi:hypothetical protein
MDTAPSFTAALLEKGQSVSKNGQTLLPIGKISSEKWPESPRQDLPAASCDHQSDIFCIY